VRLLCAGCPVLRCIMQVMRSLLAAYGTAPSSALACWMLFDPHTAAAAAAANAAPHTQRLALLSSRSSRSSSSRLTSRSSSSSE
jgi:hypothetical protein